MGWVALLLRKGGGEDVACVLLEQLNRWLVPGRFLMAGWLGLLVVHGVAVVDACRGWLAWPVPGEVESACLNAVFVDDGCMRCSVF
jgi:hypothetical protein